MKKTAVFSALSTLLAVIFLGGCMGASEQEVSSQGGCIPRRNMSGIVGGSKVSTSDVFSKNVVMITADDSMGRPFICTGTLVARNAVLTAAHCTDNASNIKIIFHTDLICETGFNLDTHSIRVITKNVNGSYRPNIKGAYDLALLRLEADAPANYPVMPMYNGSSSLTSRKVTFLGYGKTGTLKNDSMFLRKVTKDRSKISRNGLNLLIDQKDKQGICHGDSGGPIFYEVDGKLQLAGVNSTVGSMDVKTQCEYEAVGMYIPSHRAWIDRVLANWKK